MGDCHLDATTNRAPLARPIVFGPKDSSLFGVYHPARAAVTRDCSIVMCNPLGYEAICAHRAYRHIAERLAHAGFATLRFDYYGTGDSAGDEYGEACVAAWIASIHAAISEARVRSHARETSILGLRFGATLAMSAAASFGGVDSAILWAPCSSGGAYLREMRVVGAASGQGDRVKGGPLPRANGSSNEGGDEESAGFLFTKTTILDVERLDLAAIRQLPARRALILSRASVANSDKRVGAALRALGTHVEHAAHDGYSSMMLDPHESVVPTRVIDAVERWLVEVHGSARNEAAPSVEVAREERPLVVSTAEATQECVERPVRFGDGKLFGILTQTILAVGSRPGFTAAAQGRHASTVGVVLANVGAIHRVGPGRFYVSMARALALLGFPTLRLDLSGIGDSPPAQGALESEVYAPSAIADLRAAMDHLEQNLGIQRFVVVGLCSGAYAAYQTARVDPRTVGLIIGNLPTFQWRSGDQIGAASPTAIKATGFYGRALLRKKTWQRVWRRNVHARAIASVLAERLTSLAIARVGSAWSFVRGQSGESEVTRALHAICAKGANIMVLYSRDDPGLDQAELHFSSALLRNSRFRLEIFDGADHTFSSRDAQRRLMEVFLSYFR